MLGIGVCRKARYAPGELAKDLIFKERQDMGNNKKRFTVPFAGKLCAAVLSAILLVSTAGDSTLLMAGADTKSDIELLEEKIKKISAENEERENKIKQLDGNIANNKQDMALVQAQIDGTNAEIKLNGELITLKIQDIENKIDEIDAVELTILDKENEIEQKKQQITELQAQNKENLDKFAQLARAMYMTDSSNVIPVLNGSDDWYKYFVYSDVVRNISQQTADFMLRLQNSIKHQETLIDNLNSDIVSLQADKADLQQQKADFEKDKAELEQSKADLQAFANDRLAYLNTLAAKDQSFRDQVNGLQSEIQEGMEEVEEINKEIEELIRLAQQNGDVAASTGAYMWPVEQKFQTISTYFGYDGWRGGMHYGLDICGGGIADTNIYATQPGRVIKVSNTCTHNYPKTGRHSCGGGYGNYIIIDHGGEISSLYAHCASINVYEGQIVDKGDVIGIVGTTGWSTGHHLHFEIRKNGKATNPFDYKPFIYK